MHIFLHLQDHLNLNLFSCAESHFPTWNPSKEWQLLIKYFQLLISAQKNQHFSKPHWNNWWFSRVFSKYFTAICYYLACILVVKLIRFLWDFQQAKESLEVLHILCMFFVYLFPKSVLINPCLFRQSLCKNQSRYHQ